ncbi:unnamed protein product [Arctogadus glacialis]
MLTCSSVDSATEIEAQIPECRLRPSLIFPQQRGLRSVCSSCQQTPHFLLSSYSLVSIAVFDNPFRAALFPYISTQTKLTWETMATEGFV